MTARRIPLLILCVSLLPLAAAAAEPGPDVRVMSFNIRFGTAADGDNHWDKRKEFLADTIKTFDPDLLGTQESTGRSATAGRLQITFR